MSEPVSHLEHQMTASLQRCCETGVFFNFRLPKTGYSLRRVTLDPIDGVPKLVFGLANSIDQPTITEEDVAVAARLATEGIRPEFYYIGIPPGHPFEGRQYKEYKPKWLRGTSVGELLAEADWKMKCLSIGAKTNANKTMFWAASETSQLEGQLGTILDFPRSKESGSIKMSCKSVKVKKTSSDLLFVEEPKMQIIDDASAAYTKYITEMYDSVAYYDEPSYLKMPELIKLIQGMEFLVKEKGVKFDYEWYMTASSRSAASQAIEVSEKDIPEVDFRKLPDHLPPAAKEEVKFMAKTKTGVQFQHNESPETTCAVSIKDYDLLYQGFNPQEPVSFDGSIVPDVDSWAELHAETVPWPRVWKFPFPAVMTAGGGVTTRHIPTTYVQPSKDKTTPSSRGGMSNGTIGVEKIVERERQYEKVSDGSLSVSSSSVRTSSSPSKPPPEDMLPPRDKPSRAPRRNVNPNTKESHRNKAVERACGKSMYGYKDEGSIKVHDSNGTLILQGESMKFAAQSMDENGEETSRVMGHIPFPILPNGTGSSMHRPPVPSITSDTGISDPGDDGVFSPSNDGDSSSRFTYVSPIGSGDEMED